MTHHSEKHTSAPTSLRAWVTTARRLATFGPRICCRPAFVSRTAHAAVSKRCMASSFCTPKLAPCTNSVASFSSIEKLLPSALSCTRRLLVDCATVITSLRRSRKLPGVGLCDPCALFSRQNAATLLVPHLALTNSHTGRCTFTILSQRNPPLSLRQRPH